MDWDRQPDEDNEEPIGRGYSDGDGDEGAYDADGTDAGNVFARDAGNLNRLADASLGIMGTNDESTGRDSVLDTNELAAVPVAADPNLTARAGDTADRSTGSGNVVDSADLAAVAITPQGFGGADVGGPSPLATF